MKGWRPSALPEARNRFGLGEAGVFLPDVGSIGLSFSAGPGAFASWTRGSLLAQRGSAAGRSGGNGAHASHRDAIRDRKTAPALRLLERPEEPETKTKGPTKQPEANGRRVPYGQMRLENERCHGDRRK